MDQKLGAYAFMAGIVIAIVAGALGSYLGGIAVWIPLILVLLGLVVGFLNISDKETTGFLVASISLMVIGSAGVGAIPMFGPVLYDVLRAIGTFVAPAALIVALKAIYGMASSH